MTTRDEQRHLASFEAAMLPHLDAAYNLARWIARSEMDAQDIVQEAYLRAFRFFSGFKWGRWTGMADGDRSQYFVYLDAAESRSGTDRPFRRERAFSGLRVRQP